MGILDKVGEIAGAVAAVEGLEKVDSDAGLLAKGAAAIAGFEGAGALESLLGKKDGNADNADSTTASADDSTDADSSQSQS
ncbi:hypothetical protein CY652_17010 [Burkholderia sp. WAC0059]|uniref:hypothetical protein n=1 Tax=Burkholderia sp. WAC0059 TaxID=2066022 RepID=UPI000C7EA56A|nr:hypothetical protein [Burkholderia sp. WAC0059]PLZ01299.1 hypothetical protein CY652_17010 [Burkholderia sp. WAC0059]